MFKHTSESEYQGGNPRDPTAQMAGLEVFLRMAFMLKNQPVVNLVFLQHAEKSDALDYLHTWFDESKTELLGEYSKFGVNAFNCFGKPFDHLRQRANEAMRGGTKRYKHTVNENSGQKEECDANEETYNNVADCPVDFEKQDGYHEGLLFVNWHPGPLGHSTMANQLAYHYTDLMVKAINNILAHKSDLDSYKKHIAYNAKPKPLPENRHCADSLCKFRPMCAYSYLPKAQGPDVGDLMVNSSDMDSGNEDNRGRNMWLNELAPNQAFCSDEQFQRDKCFAESAKQTDQCKNCVQARSYLDYKRAMAGSKASGPIKFRIPTKMKRCEIWLCEPPYEWAKDMLTANFWTDISVKVNGNPCTKDNGCFSVRQTGYKQCALISASGLLGGNDKCQSAEPNSVIVQVDVTPTEFPAKACEKRDEDGRKQCRFGSRWAGTSGDDNACQMDNDECRVNSSFKRKLDEVVAYFSEVIAF